MKPLDHAKVGSIWVFMDRPTGMLSIPATIEARDGKDLWFVQQGPNGLSASYRMTHADFITRFNDGLAWIPDEREHS